MSDKPISSIRLVAWKIAEEFKTLPRRVFKRAIKLDKKENGGQKDNRWWDKQTTYDVNVAAHVAECLKWWSLSPDEKDRARELEKNRKKSETAQKEFQNEFPFDKAFLEDAPPRGFPTSYGQITELSDVIAGVTTSKNGRKISNIKNEALVVAYLEGLAEIYKDRPYGPRLRKLAKKAANKAAPYCKAKMKWSAFRKEAAEEIRRLLPLD